MENFVTILFPVEQAKSTVVLLRVVLCRDSIFFVSITPFHCSMSRAVTPYDLVSFFFFFVKL
jgi:hypothetical protein